MENSQASTLRLRQSSTIINGHIAVTHGNIRYAGRPLLIWSIDGQLLQQKLSLRPSQHSALSIPFQFELHAPPRCDDCIFAALFSENFTKKMSDNGIL